MSWVPGLVLGTRYNFKFLGMGLKSNKKYLVISITFMALLKQCAYIVRLFTIVGCDIYFWDPRPVSDIISCFQISFLMGDSSTFPAFFPVIITRICSCLAELVTVSHCFHVWSTLASCPIFPMDCLRNIRWEYHLDTQLPCHLTQGLHTFLAYCHDLHFPMGMCMTNQWKHISTVANVFKILCSGWWQWICSSYWGHCKPEAPLGFEEVSACF